MRDEFTRLKQNASAIKGMYYLTMIVMNLPKQAAVAIIEYLSTKPALYCSNIQVGESPCSIEGVQTRKISTLIPSMQDVAGGFVICTHRDTLWLSFTVDKARCKDAKMVVELFEKTLDQVMISLS